MNEGREQRIVVLHEVAQGQLTAAAAAVLLALSVRQVRRLVKAYRRVGAQAVEHGNRGRQPIHTVPPALRERIVALAQTTYRGCNHQHLSELLAEREGLAVSRATVRRILLAAGLHRAQPTGQRPPRQRRPRYPQAGMLVQLDGSAHAWLEERGPHFTLLACIDDATGAVPAALFHPVEDAHGYFLLMQQLVAGAGRPLALYHDRHGIFQVNPQRAWSGQAQLAGHPEPTQFGRLLGELGITSIAAQSPQAKGRDPQAGAPAPLPDVARPPGGRVAPSRRGHPGGRQRLPRALPPAVQRALRRPRQRSRECLPAARSGAAARNAVLLQVSPHGGGG